MHVKSHSISLFPIKTLQNLKTGNKPLSKIVTLKCITNIPEPWWCKWATSSIAEEGKISLPSFYFLPARSRDFPLAVWVQSHWEKHITRHWGCFGYHQQYNYIMSLKVLTFHHPMQMEFNLWVFWCILMNTFRTKAPHELQLMNGRFFTSVLFCPKTLCAIICEDIFMAWAAYKLLPFQFASHAV